MTISADTLALLIEQGISGDALVAIVRSMEADRGPAKTAGADRQRRYRERVKAAALDDVTDNVTRDVTDGDATPTPSPSFLPDPQTNPTPAPVGRSRTREAAGIRLPENWKPAKLNRNTVAGQVIERRGQPWAKRALETFENHWRAKSGRDACKRDWQATWANWVMEQDRRDGKNGGSNREHQLLTSGIGRTAAAALDVFGNAGGGPH